GNTLSLGNGNTTVGATFDPLPDRPEQKAPAEHPGLVLINNSDCAACHNPKVTTVGPSYAAIAQRYGASDSTMLAQRIIEGGSGNWGQIPMTAHPEVSREAALQMVDYIYTLKPQPEES